MSSKPPLLYTDDHPDGRELPWRWIICSHCDGHGKSSAYLGAFTREDMDDAGDEFMEDYLAGRYDRACDHCEGGKVRVVDESKLDAETLKQFRRQEREHHESLEIERQERLMEGGWREEGWYDG